MGENGGEGEEKGRRKVKVKVKVKGDEVSNWMVMCTLAGAGGWGGEETQGWVLTGCLRCVPLDLLDTQNIG